MQSSKNQGAEGSRTPPSPPFTVRTIHTETNRRCARSDPSSDDEHSENFNPHKALKVPHIEDIEKIVWKQIKKASEQLRKEVEP